MQDLFLASLMINRYASKLVPGESTKITVGGNSHVIVLAENPVTQLLQFIADLGKGDPSTILWSAADPKTKETEGVTSTFTLVF